MRVVLPVLSFLVIAALGVGGWFLLGSRDSMERGASLSQEAALAPQEADQVMTLPGVGAPEIPVQGESSPVSERIDLVEEVPDQPTSIREIRSLSGRVLDDLGQPVPDARVLVGRSSEFGGIPLERLVGLAGELGRVEEGKTDGEGRFRLETSLRGELRFVIRAPAFAPLRSSREVTGGDVAMVADFILERGVILSGHVVDEAGTGIPGVGIETIEAASGGLFTLSWAASGREPQTRSGPGGAFEVNELAVGPYLLRLGHPEYLDLKVEGAVDRPGQAVTGMSLVMKRGSTIAGRVIGVEPGQASELLVRALPSSDVDIDMLDVFNGARLAELTADGSFELRGLGEGKYRLTAIEASDGESIFAEAKSAITIAETGQRDVLIDLRKPAGLTLRVLDATTNAPVTRFKVEAGVFRPRDLKDREGMVWPESPDGRATFPDVPPEELSTTAGSGAHLRVSAVGYESLSVTGVELAPGTVVDLGDVRLSPVATITVVVLDDLTGEPIEGARASLHVVDESMESGGRRVSMALNMNGDEGFVMSGQDGTSSGRTDEKGVVELPSLPGQRCSLEVSHRNYAQFQGDPVSLPQEGGLELEARMVKGGTVIVTVLGAEGAPKSGVRVRHSPAATMGSSRKSNSQGIVKFAHLAGGLYYFEIVEAAGPLIMSSDTASMTTGIAADGDHPARRGVEVEVREGASSEITLVARPEGSVSGRVTEAGEPLVGATISFEEGFGREDSLHRRMFGFAGGPSDRTDSQGRYRLDALKVGDYLMKVSHPKRAMQSSFEVSVHEGDNQIDQDLPVAILEGRVTDSEGRGVAGITVKVGRYREPGSGELPYARVGSLFIGTGSGGGMAISSEGVESFDSRTDANGHYVLRGVQDKVKLYVETSSSQYQAARSEPVTCGENQTRRDVDIEVYEAGEVRIAVLDAVGAPISMGWVELEFVGEADPMPDPVQGFIGDSGETSIGSLRPGRWRASGRTMAMYEGDVDRQATPVVVEVVAGETAELTLHLLE